MCREFVDIERKKRRRHARLDDNDINRLLNEKFHVWFQNKVNSS
jgi:hypothetical protein